LTSFKMSECCCCITTIVGVILGLLGLLKFYLWWTLGIFNGKERLDGKTVIVTGASAGVGMESARDFARRGARVVMTCRDMKKGEKVRQGIIKETGNNNVTLKRLDFADLASVRSCAKEILKEEARIDILLNNAGAGDMGKKFTDDGLQILMQSNHFGPFLFTNILLGKIRKSTPSRIVNVSSVGHKWAKLDLDHLDQSTVNRMLVYPNTKLANIYFTIVLADKLRGKGVTVNSLHPGAVKTEFMRNIPTYVKVLLAILFGYFAKTAEEGAQTQIMLCVSKDVEHVTGEYFSDCKKEELSAVAKDKKRAAKLWELSEIAVKLQDDEIHYK